MIKKIINIILLGLVSYFLLKSDLLSSLDRDLLFSYGLSQVLLIFVCCLVAQHLMYLRWLRFLRKLGVETNSELLCMWHHRSVLVGYFIFGFITSDFLRVYNARSSEKKNDLGARLLFSSQATILDRLFSLVSLILVSSLAIPIAWLALDFDWAAIILIPVIFSLLIFLYYGALFFKSQKKDIYILNLIKLIKDQVLDGKNSLFMLIQFLISISANIIMGFAFFIICKSDYSLMPFSISVLSLSNLTAIIPLTPAGLGFAEGLSEYLLTAKGILLGAEAIFVLRIFNLLVTLIYWTVTIVYMEKKS